MRARLCSLLVPKQVFQPMIPAPNNIALRGASEALLDFARPWKANPRLHANFLPNVGLHTAAHFWTFDDTSSRPEVTCCAIDRDRKGVEECGRFMETSLSNRRHRCTTCGPNASWPLSQAEPASTQHKRRRYKSKANLKQLPVLAATCYVLNRTCHMQERESQGSGYCPAQPTATNGTRFAGACLWR